MKLTNEEKYRMVNVQLEDVATWKSIDLMEFCIENDLYTGGDSTRYNMMLDFVRENPCTDYNLRLVAMDIVIHSYTGNGDIPLSIYPTYHCQDDVSFMIDELLENVVRFK